MKAEVDKKYARLLGGFGLVDDEEIPWMWVGMEKTIDEDLLRIGTGQNFKNGRRGDSESRQSSAVADVDTRLILHCENSF